MFRTNTKHNSNINHCQGNQLCPKTNTLTDVFFSSCSSNIVSFKAFSICCLQRSICCCKTYLERGAKGKLGKSSNKISLLLYLDFALQEQRVFRLNAFVPMKEPSLRYFGECCVCMPLVTGFSSCEEKMSVALFSNSSLTFSDLV